MTESGSSIKRKSLLESKTIFIIILVAAAVFITSFIVDRFGESWDVFRPEGVGPVNSDHVHGRFTIILDGTYVDTNTERRTELAYSNNYIFVDEQNYLHRVARGATFGMFLQSIGIQLTEDCLNFSQDIYDLDGTLFERKSYCNEGEMKAKMYVNGKLVEDGPNHLLQSGDAILIAFDDDNSETRDYPQRITTVEGAEKHIHEP